MRFIMGAILGISVGYILATASITNRIKLNPIPVIKGFCKVAGVECEVRK